VNPSERTSKEDLMGFCQMRYGVVFACRVRMLRIGICAHLGVLLYWRTPQWSVFPISCLRPIRVDPRVQGLKVIIDCALPGKSSQATYRPTGGLSAAAMHGDAPSREWFKQGVQRNSVRSLESENQVGTG